MNRASIILVSLLFALSGPAGAQLPAEQFEALRAADLRLATIGERLVIANAPLCTARKHATGLVLHDLAQYAPGARAAARAHFGFATAIAVEAVVPGSPAAAAGVRADDSLVSIDGAETGIAMPTADAKATTERALGLDAAIDRAGADGVLTLGVIRAGRALTLTIRPVEACKTRFELSLDRAFNAEADGSIVQIAAGMFEGFRDDDEAAAILAHELAHNLLKHRERLDAAGVQRGLFEAFGRAVGYIRRTEIEADLVGVALALNAGYDPAAAARFWRWFGPKHADSIFLARTHPKWSTRARLLDREVGALATLSVRPVRPPLLATADAPLSNDWRALTGS
jgi:membrane-associated protease RseP (regulator of RpoE activity)